MKKVIKRMGKTFLIFAVILVVVYTMATEGVLTSAANSIEEHFDHKCKNLVETSYLEGTRIPLKEAFDKFFGEPSWEQFYSKEGNIVEFNGKCTFQNTEVNCTIQYLISNDKKTFTLYTMAFNDVPQNVIIYGELLNSIERANITTPQDQQQTPQNQQQTYTDQDACGDGNEIYDPEYQTTREEDMQSQGNVAGRMCTDK